MKLSINRFIAVIAFISYSTVALCQVPEPASQPTNIQFSNIKAYSATLKFNRTIADGYLVLKSDRNITDVPTDGVMYEKGQGLMTSKVLFVGNQDSFFVREMVENSTYYFKVYAYNGSGANINYLQSNPLSGSFQSSASDPGSYYFSIDTSTPYFLNNLSQLINNHIFISYSPGYRTTILPILYERDTTAGNAVINCEYSSEETLYVPPFDFASINYSREHVLPRSWMKTFPDFGSSITNRPEGADFFNLLLTFQNNVNAVRSNYSLGIVTNVTSTYKGTKFGKDSGGKTVFEPRDDKKGDAARCMFYQIVAYNGLNGSWALKDLLSFGPDQDQSILKQWHQQDPPDKFERTKNEFIYSIQNNRNPFIDFPEWVECINFDDLTNTSLCGSTMSIVENITGSPFVITPNPNKGSFKLECNSDRTEALHVSIYNSTGSKCFENIISIHPGFNSININTQQLSTGIYWLRIGNKQNETVNKLVLTY